MKHLRLFVAAIAAVFGLSSYAQSWTGDDPANGDFFLYNVGAKKFVSAGDPVAQWGTNAYLTEQATLDFGFTDLEDGTYSLDSRHSNGGTSHFFTDALWVDGAQAGSKWTVTSTGDADNSFTLACNGVYMVANAAGTDVETVSKVNDNNGKWLLLSKNTLVDGLSKATPSNPMDATFFIQCSTFNRNDTEKSYWNCERSGGNYVIAGPSGQRGTYGCELWNNTFDFYQTITGLVPGTYELTVDGYGTNGTTYIYAGDIVEKPFKNTTSTSNFATALDEIQNGSHKGNTTGQFDFTGGDLKIGLKRTSQVGQDWTVFDNFRLIYYGAPSDPMEIYRGALQKAVEDAQAIEGTVPAAAYEALAAVVAENNKEYETGDEYSTATDAIKAATENAKALQAPYSRYNDVKAAVLAVNADVPTTDPDAQANAATSTEEIEAAVAAVRKALTDYLAAANIVDSKVDLTNALIDNPSPWATTDYWTCPVPASPNTSAKVAEFWMKDGVSISQVIANLPVGFYNLKAQAFARSGCEPIYIFANEDKQELIKKSSSEINNMAGAGAWFDSGEGWNTLIFEVTEAGNVTIGLNDEFIHGTVHGDGSDGWLIWRSFGLEYLGTNPVSAMTSEYEEALAAANAAKDNETYKNITGAELTALTNAINDKPQNTVASYKEKTEALIEATKAFTEPSVVSAYDAYAAEKAIAEMIGVTVAEGPANAAAATAGVENLKVAEFNYVKDNYPYDGEGIIGNFGTWTGTATVGADRQPAEPSHLAKEHWSGPGAAYYEQAANGWENAGGWTIKYEKTATLPAGEYMLKVAARSSAGTTSLVSCSATENTVTLPNKGATGKGIALDGTAAFEGDNFAKDGAGYGWEWRYLPFTLTERTRVTMTFYAEATSREQWMSIANGTLLSKTEIVNEVELTGDDTAAPEEGVASKITTDRKLKKGLNTIVLPFDATADEIGASTVLKYGGTHETNGKTFIHFDEVAAIDGKITLQANTPYAVIVDEDQTENIVFTSMKNIAPAENLTTADVNGQYDFVGTFAKIEPGVITENDYVARAAMNAFVPAVANDSYLNAYRAYLKFVGTEAGSVAFNIGGEIIDGIEAVELMNKLTEGIYNLNGQKVSNAQKGIYIVNGKKVVLK